ncbi:hypothetical protein BDV12DRAFT_199915 [Aspergillus spectabilis]
MDIEHTLAQSKETYPNDIFDMTPPDYLDLLNCYHDLLNQATPHPGDPDLSVQTREAFADMYDQAPEEQNNQEESPDPANEHTPEEIELRVSLFAQEHDMREFCKNLGKFSKTDALQHGETVLGLLRKNGAREKTHVLYRTRCRLLIMVDKLRKDRARMRVLERQRTRETLRGPDRRRNNKRKWHREARRKRLAAQEAKRARKAQRAQRTQSLERREDYYADERKVNEKLRRKRYEDVDHERGFLYREKKPGRSKSV